MTAFEFFVCYEDLQKKVDEKKYVQLTHRNSRTPNAASKRVPKRVEIDNKVLRGPPCSCFWWDEV